MQSGKLRQRITIQQKNATISAEGEQTFNWGTFVARWADIRTISGKEYYAHDTTQAQATHRIYIRWTDNVLETMRISWNSRIFNIVHVGEDRTHERMMVLTCEEIK